MDHIDFDFFEDVFILNCYKSEEFLSKVVNHASPEVFSSRDNGAVYTILAEYYTKHGRKPNNTELLAYITSESIRQQFKRVLQKISTLENFSDEQELYSTTEKFLKEKIIFNTMMDYAGQLQGGNTDTAEIIQKVESACDISLDVDIGLDLFNNPERLIADLNTTEEKISTGWKWLDEKLDGGFLRKGKALYVFPGQPNVGKSIVLGNIATNIAKQDKNVLLISFEMSEMVYARRLSANITKIPVRELKNNCEDLKSKLSSQNGSILIKEFPPSTITVGQLRTFIKRLLTQGVKIDAIVVDYLNLIAPGAGDNMYEKIKIIIEQLRALSYIFKVPIITATQLNRDGYGVDPELKAISESSGTAATADFIAAVFQLDEDAENNNLRFGLLKNRFGPNFGSIIMNIDYPTLTVSEDYEAQTMQNRDGSLDAFDTLEMLSK